ncbi:hypothetical protein NPIL_487191, partial [Nephila pilipes]
KSPSDSIAILLKTYLKDTIYSNRYEKMYFCRKAGRSRTHLCLPRTPRTRKARQKRVLLVEE